jgi:hypothetical protein
MADTEFFGKKMQINRNSSDRNDSQSSDTKRDALVVLRKDADTRSSTSRLSLLDLPLVIVHDILDCLVSSYITYAHLKIYVLLSLRRTNSNPTIPLTFRADLISTVQNFSTRKS